MTGKVGGDLLGSESGEQMQDLSGTLGNKTPQGGLLEHLSTPAVTEQLSLLMFGQTLSTATTDDASDNVQHSVDTSPR